MKNKNSRTFYYGTSTMHNIQIGEELSPIRKIITNRIQKDKYKYITKVSVTDDIDAARFYAKREAETHGGFPIIYTVEPDGLTILRISKTDYSTSKAVVTGVVKENV